ncbi:hypothetical protein F6V30_14360 [Oryzomonas sagensis]|uniref:Uncharacterized protein n=1 Tax=Oryzomonas sagensis TaxID=2603857 RepID=A0ABQ6TLG2_9BACT|nr:hypothetical protein [Oryzomonas sagensis]KAB0669016.1 hypothetical protein F6V30_14360 [Oryzomonas sagensis]
MAATRNSNFAAGAGISVGSDGDMMVFDHLVGRHLFRLGLALACEDLQASMRLSSTFFGLIYSLSLRKKYPVKRIREALKSYLISLISCEAAAGSDDFSEIGGAAECLIGHYGVSGELLDETFADAAVQNPIFGGWVSGKAAMEVTKDGMKGEVEQ